MKEYSIENTCPKCGSGETKDEWLIDQQDSQEYIKRTCIKCEYVRFELPLDTKVELE